MRHLYTTTAFIAASAASAQLVNGSFEVNGGFTLQGWEWTCADPQALPEAPVGGGNWSAFKEPGHAKGCFPSYLFQRLPDVQYGIPYQLSGWVKCPQDEFSVCLGGSIGFGTISNGQFTLAQNVTSQSEEWTFLTIDHVFDPGIGDTAIVVLNSGFIGGPINPLPAGFDHLTLDLANGVGEPLPVHISLIPDPVTDRLNVGSTVPVRRLELFDATGRTVIVQAASGTTTIMDVSNLLDGAYILRATTTEGIFTRRFSKR